MNEAQIGSPTASANGSVPHVVAKMTKLFGELCRDTRLEHEKVTRPHPLLIAATRDDLMVVLAPSAVWDRGRELLKPFAARFADATAMLVLLGYPQSVDLQQAMNRGLASIVSAEPTVDEVFLAGMRAFELLGPSIAEHPL